MTKKVKKFNAVKHVKSLSRVALQMRPTKIKGNKKKDFKTKIPMEQI